MQKHEAWLALAEDDLKVVRLILNSDEIVLGPVFSTFNNVLRKR